MFPDNLNDIFVRLRLEHEVDLITSTKNHGNQHPYHNGAHCLNVAKRCFEAATFYDLGYSSIRALLLAALFHDFGHTGGRLDDSENIKNALFGLSVHAPSSGIDKQFVTQLIRITEFPFKYEPLLIEEKILRDADLLTIAQPDWYSVLIHGLRHEISVAKGIQVTELEMMEGQIKFMDSAKFYTNWGQQQYERWWPDRRNTLVKTLKQFNSYIQDGNEENLHPNGQTES